MGLKQGCGWIGGLLLALSAIVANAEAPLAPSVVASQGGVSVTMADIDTFASTIPEDRRAQFFDSPQRIQTLISSLLLQKQLAAEAREHGLDKNPEIISKAGSAQEAALAKAMQEQLTNGMKIPDFNELAQEQYIAYRERYVVPAILEVQDVVITAVSRSEAEARALADTVEAEARKDPSQFDALVEKYSDESGKAKSHGMVKDAASAGHAEGFASAIAALKSPGDISPVVKTDGEFHVLKLVAKAPAKQKSFDDVREELVAGLRKDFIQRTIKEHIDQLRNKHIDASPELVASLRTRFASGTSAPSAEGAASKK